MITRDLSPIPYSDGKISVAERAKAIMQYGSSWPADMKSQNVVERHLGRTLDNSHTLLRNIRISGADITVPLILISSQGITVLQQPDQRYFSRSGKFLGQHE